MATTKTSQNAQPTISTSASDHGIAVTLDPGHTDYFRERAVDPACAVGDGARSVSADETEQQLVFKLRSRLRGLAFFYPGALPQFVRVRLDDGAYLTPAGSPIPIYFPFARDEPNEPLLVAESPTKCLALKEAGFLAVGLGGVATCLTKDGLLNDSWQKVSLAGRDVILLFDNDIGKPQVCIALHRLALALERGGAVVRYAALPPSATKVGPDDFLAAHGALALKALLDAAEPANPEVRVEAVEKAGGSPAARPAAVAALLADSVFMVGLLERGPSTIAKCRPLFQRAKMARDFQNALTATKSELRGALSRCAGAQPRYEVVDGGLQTAEGKRLTNFVARIMKEISLDDGAETKVFFLVEAELEDGTPLGAVTMEPRDFLRTNWPTERLGAAAQVYPGPRALEEVAAAIQSLSQPEKVRMYARTGFAEVDGCPVFLMPSNSLAPTASVQLPAGLHRYSFADASHDLPTAFGLVARLLDLGPDRIVVPLLLAAMRAPLNSLLSADFAIHVYGTTGALKSTLVAVMASFFGTFTYSTLPASFSDTINSLEFKANVLRDVLLPVDELVVRSNSSFDEVLGKAVALFRSVGNGAAKGLQIVLNVEQTLTGFAGVNDLVDWVLPTAIRLRAW